MIWYFIAWLYHVSLAFVLSLPLLIFGRKRAQWMPWELLIFVVPYVTWAICSEVGSLEKSLGNFNEATIDLAVVIPIAVALRVLLARRA
jgi:hypothetical protein